MIFNEEPYFKRFMIKFNNSYFSLSTEEQQKYRMENITELTKEAETFFIENVLNIDSKDYNDLSQEQTFRYNIFMSYVKGVGVNKFHLNESFAENENTSTFKTLYDYDYDDHIFQEKSIKENDENYEEKPYISMRVNSNWARAFVKIPNTPQENKFHYLILNSLSSDIYMHLEEVHTKIIDELIPHDLKISTERSEDGFHSMTFNYFEKNKNVKLSEKNKTILESLNAFGYKALNKIYEQVKVDVEAEKHNSIYVSASDNSDDEKYDPSLTYIFSDTEVIKNIRFENWQEDIEKYFSKDFRIVVCDKRKKYGELLESKIKEEFERLKKNYNPKIIKLKKKNKKIKLSSQVKNIIDPD